MFTLNQRPALLGLALPGSLLRGDGSADQIAFLFGVYGHSCAFLGDFDQCQDFWLFESPGSVKPDVAHQIAGASQDREALPCKKQRFIWSGDRTRK